MMWYFARSLVVLLALSALWGCQATASNLPTHKDMQGSAPTALQKGRLVATGQCLYLDDPVTGDQLLVLWPPGYSLRGTSVLDNHGAVAAQIGDTVEIGGGGYGPADVTAVVDAKPSCSASVYWLATTTKVIAASPSSALPS